MAFGAMVALRRRVSEGGSWLVRISLALVGRWLVGRGQVPEALLEDVPKEFTSAELERWSLVSQTPVGRLHHLAPVLRLSETDRKSTRLNSSHSQISYAVFCLKKKKVHAQGSDPCKLKGPRPRRYI